MWCDLGSRAQAGHGVAWGASAARQAARQGHFMPPSLMASQFATLEDTRDEPDALSGSVTAAPQAVVDTAMAVLGPFGLKAGP
jgi:gluconokinase